MSRLDRYYIPPGVPARPPAPPLPRKGILLMPPPPPPPSSQQASSIISTKDGNWSYQATRPIQVAAIPAYPVALQQPASLPLEKFRPDRRRPMMPKPTGVRSTTGSGSVSNCYEELRQPFSTAGRPLDSQNVTTAMSLPDSSPRLALQRILMLYEKGEHREAANFLRRLSFQTFRQLLPQLPAESFIEAMPHSLPILEALYGKVFMCGDGKLLLAKSSGLRPEAVVWQLVKFFAGQEEGMVGQMRWEFCGPFISSCKRLLSVLIAAEPRLKRLVTERRRALMKAIEGLGQHGMVGTSDEQLISLHNALKQEFDKAQKAYLEGIQKLEALSLLRSDKNGKSGHGTISGKSAPIAQSHQRQLSLKAMEIQERLIKNKSLLNVVEPTLENTSLEVLLGILQKRIELDKECLFQYTQIKKDALQLIKQVNGGNVKNLDDQSVAPIFMRYQRGCQQVGRLCQVNSLFFSIDSYSGPGSFKLSFRRETCHEYL